MLEARHFIVFTDHKPLIYAFHRKRDKCSPQQFNHLDFISQFTTDIRHISGQDNIVADALSQVEVITTPPTHDTLAAAQDKDDELKTLLVSGTALQLTKLHIPGTSAELYCDTSAGKPPPTSPLLSGDKYSNPSIPSAILVSRHQPSSSPSFSCGQPCKKTAAYGPEFANPASAPRFPDTPSHLAANSQSHWPASCISTLTSLVPYRHLQVFSSASLQWTDSRADWKSFPSRTSRHRLSHVPCSQDGSHVLAALRPSQQTKDAISSRSCSTVWQDSVGSTSPGRLLTILHPMASWSGYTALLKPPSCAMLMTSGPRLYRWSFLAYDPPTKKT